MLSVVLKLLSDLGTITQFLHCMCYKVVMAHYLSRHTSLVGNNKQSTIAEEYVNLLTSLAVPKAMMLQEIQQATTEDATMQCLMHLTRTQEWHNLDKLPE